MRAPCMGGNLPRNLQSGLFKLPLTVMQIQYMRFYISDSKKAKFLRPSEKRYNHSDKENAHTFVCPLITGAIGLTVS